MSEGTYQPDSLLDGENAANSPAGQQKVAASNPTGYMPGDDLRLIELLRSGNETAVDPNRFWSADQQRAGTWVSFPRSWDEIPEERILSEETRTYIEEAIQALPSSQREVITLRDIEGWTADETCSFLGVSEANQRVLLHRARSKVRRALEQYFEEE